MRLLAAMLALGLAGAAHAEALKIAVGQPGRGYEARGIEIGKRLALRGIEVTVLNFEGSDAISLAVCDGRAQIGLMQIDAIYARDVEGCSLKPIGTYGDEFAFILFPPDSRLNELDDLNADHRILVDTIGSGTELFWRTIVSIETGDQGNNSRWSEAQPVYDLTALADTLQRTGAIDAMLMVGVPNNDEVHRLIGQGWTVGELFDKDINDMQYNGTSLYARQRVEINPPDARRVREDAYVVPSFIVTTEAFAEQDRALYGALVTAATQ